MLNYVKFAETFFSGVIVPLEYFPLWMSWLKYLMPSYHAFRAVVYHAVKGRNFDCSAAEQLSDGAVACYTRTAESVLRAAHFEPGDTAEANVMALIIMMLGWFAIAWAVKWYRMSRRPHYLGDARESKQDQPRAGDWCAEDELVPGASFSVAMTAEGLT